MILCPRSRDFFLWIACLVSIGFGSSFANAQDRGEVVNPPLDRLDFDRPAPAITLASVNGTGCTPQSAKYTNSHRLSAVQFLDMATESGPGIPLRAGRRTCLLQLQVKQEPKTQYGLVSVTARGRTTTISRSPSRVVSLAAFIPGQTQDYYTLTERLDPFLVGAFEVTPPPSQHLWSTCYRESFSLNINLMISGSDPVSTTVRIDDVVMGWQKRQCP